MIDVTNGRCTPDQLAGDPALRARHSWTPVTRAGVIKAIESGTIPATKIGRRWVIDLAALDELTRYKPPTSTAV